MARDEWAFWQSGALDPDFASGFDGMSLFMTGAQLGTWYADAQLKNTSPKTKGITSGRFRASFMAVQGAPVSIYTDFGLYVLADTNVPGPSNFVAVYNSQDRVTLVMCGGNQQPKGSAVGADVTLLGSAELPYSMGTVRTNQIQWIYVPPSSVDFLVSIGTAEDYSDLEVVITRTVTSFVMDTNHASEGVYANQYDALDEDHYFQVWIDNLELHTFGEAGGG